MYMSPFHAIFFKASHWPSDHMIISWPLIGLSELCILDGNSEDLQYLDGFLDEKAEEVHNLHCTLQSPDGLLMKKMRSWGPSELCPLYENLSIIFNLLMKNSVGKCISATIRIGQEIRLDLLVSNFRKGKYCPATPTTPTTTTLSRSGDTPGF